VKLVIDNKGIPKPRGIDFRIGIWETLILLLVCLLVWKGMMCEEQTDQVENGGHKQADAKMNGRPACSYR